MNDIISVVEGSTLRYNVITSIASDLSSVGIAATTSVDGVFTGTVITTGNYTANLRVAEIKNSENGFLYANLPESNISSVDLSNSQLSISKQIDQNAELDVSGNTLNFDISNTGITSAFYRIF